MLLARVGQKKQRLWPWFKPPAAGAPVKYFGWYWDPEYKEWLPLDITKLMVKVPIPDLPRPTEVPSRTQPARVPGWEYNFEYFQWVYVARGMPIVEFAPPRPLPPDMVMEDVYEAAVYNVDIEAVIASLQLKDMPAAGLTRVHIDNLILMLEKSGYTRAAADKVMAQYVKLTAGLDAVQKGEVWKKATDAIFRCWQRTHLVGTTDAQWYWARSVRNQMREITPLVGPAAAVTILGIIATVTGILLGRLLDLLTTPEEDTINLKEPEGTYLMRYDHYLYSKMVAISAEGKSYYSACDDIGTSYIRHRRAPRGGTIDIIDFPGGFVEEGHKGIYFVKYTWRTWILEYTGFLTSIGGNFYVMREGDRDKYAVGKAPFTLEESKWCPDFRWYL